MTPIRPIEVDWPTRSNMILDLNDFFSFENFYVQIETYEYKNSAGKKVKAEEPKIYSGYEKNKKEKFDKVIYQVSSGYVMDGIRPLILSEKGKKVTLRALEDLDEMKDLKKVTVDNLQKSPDMKVD